MSEKWKLHKNGQWQLEELSKASDECHDDPKHEEKEQAKAKDIKVKAEEILDLHKNGQWSLNKGAPAEKLQPDMGHSSFNMDHVKHVASMSNHGEAKKYAHGIVDTSSANAGNKKKMKMMIDNSKSTNHLAQGMSNHVLAHPSEGLKVVKTE